MSRSRAFRAVASATSLLLVFATQQEAVGFAHCPHHGIQAAAHSDAMHGMAAGHHAAKHAGCTCIGSCGLATFTPAAAAVLALPPLVALAPAPAPVRAAPRPVLRLLPFATAPPATA